MIGLKFNRLTILSLHKKVKYKKYWLCQCDCGNKKIVQQGNLRTNHTTSCGCYRREVGVNRKTHGMTKTSTYKSWQEMKDRCLNKDSHVFSYYGARGISICNRWINSFENFYEDMGKRPEGTSLDRIDVNGSYEPINCRWATPREQACNKTNSGRHSNGKVGVTLDKKRISWVAKIQIGQKSFTLYDGKDFFEACVSRIIAENIVNNSIFDTEKILINLKLLAKSYRDYK